MNQSERIQRYLDGSLSDEEAGLFREDLLKDEGLRDEYELHLAIDRAMGMKQEENFRKKVKTVYLEYQGETGIRFKTKSEKRKRIIGIAVGLAIIITSVLLLICNDRKPDSSLVFAEYYEPLKQDFSIRGSGESTACEICPGLSFYESGEYSEAYRFFNNYLDSQPNDSVMAFFYQGLACLELSKYSEAGYAFRQVEQFPFFYFADHAKWYLTLSYIGAEELDSARLKLDEIIASGGVYGEEAKKIKKIFSH